MSGVSEMDNKKTKMTNKIILLRVQLKQTTNDY